MRALILVPFLLTFAAPAFAAEIAGPRGAQAVTVDAIRRVYEERGIVFLADGETTSGGPGVRLKASDD